MRRTPDQQLKPSPANKEPDMLLTKHCILTPFNMASTSTPTVSLSQYVKDKGGEVGAEDMKRITHDLRTALSFMRTVATSELSLTKDRIAVQLV